MKVAFIGCSADTLFLAKSLAQQSRKLKIDKISFYDSDPAVRDIFCVFCVSLCRNLDAQLQCAAESNVVEAMIGADYIITDLQGLTDPHSQETATVVRKKGLLSNPFFGASAFGAALRNVPAFMKICSQAQRYAKPGFQILNLTAPCGVLLQAAWSQGFDFVYGFPLNGLKAAAALTKLMKKDPTTVSYSFCGSAELSFITEVRVEGKQILPELLNEDALYDQTVFSGFSKNLLVRLGCLPAPTCAVILSPESCRKRQMGDNETAEKEIYRAEMRCLSALAALDFEKQRNTVLAAINKMLQNISSVLSANYGDFVLPDALNPYSIETASSAAGVIAFLQARATGEKQCVHLLYKNGQRLPMFSPDLCVSVKANVSEKSVNVIQVDETSAYCMELIRREANYEKFLSEAILSNDPFSLTCALSMHPLVNSYTVAASLFDELQKIKS